MAGKHGQRIILFACDASLRSHKKAGGFVMNLIEEPGPGAGFASLHDMLPHQWGPESFYLGETAPEIGGYPPFEVGIDDDRGVFIVAGTGGGKGVSLLVPNLIGWPGGAFCVDVKGELASITGIRRGSASMAKGSGTTVRNFLGQNVAILDPMGDVKGPASVYRCGYNALSELDPSAPSFVSDVRQIAAALVVDETGSGKHFTDMAAILVAGAIEVVKVAAPERMHNLVTVRNIVTGGKLLAFLQKAPGRPLVGEALGAMQAVGANEGGAFHTTLVRQLAWLADPRMQASVMDKSGFSLTRVIQEGGTVYVCLPPDEMNTHKRWLRLMLGMGLRAKIRQGVYGHKARQTLFVVDEMPVLGTFDLLAEGVGYLRGYGIKPVAVVQNIGQLKQLYDRNWQTFLGNAGAIAAFSTNDDETARFVSNRLGSFEFMETTHSTSTSTTTPEWTGRRGWPFTSEKVRDHEARASTQTSSSSSTQRKVEAVLRPEQVQMRTSRQTMRMIVIPADGRPMLLQRVPYFERFSQEWYEHIENIKRIEYMNKNQKLLGR